MFSVTYKVLIFGTQLALMKSMERMNTLKTILLIGASLLGACASSDNEDAFEIPVTNLDIPIAASVERVSCDSLITADTVLSLQQAAGVDEFFPNAEPLNASIFDYEDTVLAETSFSNPATTDHPFADCVETKRRSNGGTENRTLTSNDCLNLNQFRETSKTLTDFRQLENGDEFVTILADFDGVLESIETNHMFEVVSATSGESLTMTETSLFDRATPYFESPDASAPANGSKTFTLKNELDENVMLTLNLSEAFNIDAEVSCEFSQAATMFVGPEGIEIVDGVIGGSDGQAIRCDRAALEASGLTCLTAEVEEI